MITLSMVKSIEVFTFEPIDDLRTNTRFCITLVDGNEKTACLEFVTLATIIQEITRKNSSFVLICNDHKCENLLNKKQVVIWGLGPILVEAVVRKIFDPAYSF